jgi:hypothetical protein
LFFCRIFAASASSPISPFLVDTIQQIQQEQREMSKSLLKRGTGGSGSGSGSRQNGSNNNLDHQSSHMDDFDPYQTYEQKEEVPDHIHNDLLKIRQELQPNISKQLNTVNSPFITDVISVDDEDNRKGKKSKQQQLMGEEDEEDDDEDDDDVEEELDQDLDEDEEGNHQIHSDNEARRSVTTSASNSISTTTKTGTTLTKRVKPSTNNQQDGNPSSNTTAASNVTGIAAITPPIIPKRIKTTSVRERKRIGKHLSFRERPDWLKSRYFYFTFVYGLFYLIGAIVGYQRKKNLFCLIISGFIGLLWLGFSILHGIDYYSGAPLESVYVSLPFSKSSLLISIYGNHRIFNSFTLSLSLSISLSLPFNSLIVVSLFFCILMACFYAIGSVFKTSLLISIVVSNYDRPICFISQTHNFFLVRCSNCLLRLCIS